MIYLRTESVSSASCLLPLCPQLADPGSPSQTSTPTLAGSQQGEESREVGTQRRPAPSRVRIVGDTTIKTCFSERDRELYALWVG